MEKALLGLQTTIARGRLKDRHKMERRLGKIQAGIRPSTICMRSFYGTPPQVYVYSGR
jgi:hypothetical protein